MDCNEYRENLTNYYDNELTTQEKNSMLKHEANCSDCLELNSEMHIILSDIRSLSKVETSANFETLLYEKLHSHTDNSFMDKIKELLEPSPVSVRALVAGFAILMIVVSGSYFLYNGVSIGNKDGMPALSSPRFIEKTDKISTDVIEEEAIVEDEKTDEEDENKIDLDDPSENEVISE